MNTEQLKQKVSFGFAGYGHYKVTIKFRGKEYRKTTNNMPAIDAARSGDITMGMTQKQALMSLYNEVKREHELR